MIVTRGSAVDVRVAQTRPRAAVRRSAELLCLCIASLAAASGFWLVYQAKTVRFAGTDKQIAEGQLVLLDGAADPERLAQLLVRDLGSDTDAHYAARQICGRLRSGPPFTHVGMLHSLTISKADFDAHTELSLYRARWQRALESADRNHLARPERIPLLNENDIHRLKPVVLVRSPEQFRQAFLHAMPWFFLPFFTLWVFWVVRDFQGDQVLLPAVLLLSALGAIAMSSLQDPLRDSLKFGDFLTGVAAGCLVMGFCSSLHYERLGARRAWPPLVAALSLSLALVLFGRGPAGSSDTRIILFGFQPAPTIRILLVFFLAAYFARRWEFFRALALNRTGRFRILRPADLAPMTGGVALALALFLLERDTGPAVLLFTCWAALYLAARKHLVLIGASVILLAIGVSAGFRFFPQKLGTAMARIELYRNTWDNRISAQTAESIWAYGAGGATGQGLGLGYPALVPQATTDMVIPALAEETGAIGFTLIALVYGLVVWTGMRIARHAASDYQFFLALGLTVSVAAEVTLIAGGSTGVLPLSGVVSPFLSYGKSTQLIYFAVAGVLCAISARRTDSVQTVHFQVPMKAVSAAMLVLGAIIAATALTYQTVLADQVSAREVTIHSRKGGSATFPNPRLQALAAFIPRGSIYDRNGLVLASSHWEEVNAQAARFQALGIDIRRVCDPSDVRQYPAGNLTVHLLGDVREKLLSQQDRQFEHRWNNVLQGYEHLDQMLPLLRHRFDPENPAARDLLERDHSLHLTLDLPLQIRVASALAKGAASKPGAAAVIIDPSNGEVLAALSMPTPDVPIPGVAFQRPDDDALIDRARAGTFPPGSIFKLMVAEIGLMHDPSLVSRRYACTRLPGESRVGAIIPGYAGRPVRDDIRDHHPHGDLSLAEAITVSCNAFFAQFGTIDVGAAHLLEAESLFGVHIAPKSSLARLKATLPWSSFGQGEVQTGLFPVARALGVVAADGVLAPTRWITNRSEPPAVSPTLLQAESVAVLQHAMREVVTRGTGTRLLHAAISLAGKSGTAEVHDQNGNSLPSDSWFGAYNDTPGRRLVFLAMVEQGGYGGGAAASIVGDMAKAAVELNLLRR